MVLSIGLQAFIPSSAAEWLKRGHTWVSCEIFSRRHVFGVLITETAHPIR